MNNFYLNNDPLLQQQPYQQVLIPEYQQPLKDWIGDLDRQLKGLDSLTVESLNQNPEFVELNNILQSTVQEELMNLVRGRLNIQPSIVENVKKQMELVKKAANKTKEDERKSMSELNDYMKNYSNITFDEYRKIKNSNDESR